MMKRLLALCLALFALPVSANPDMAQVSLVPGWQSADGTQYAGLRIKLAPGWKTYWRAPGDAGIPPLFDWSGSGNLDAMKVHWPTPSVHHQDGMRIIAYTGDVVLPLELTPQSVNAPVDLSLTLDFGICRDICVPVSVAVNTALTPGSRRDPRLVAALLDGPSQGTGTVRCTVEPSGSGMVLSLDVPATKAREAVIELPGASWISEPKVRNRAATTTITAEIGGNGLVVDRSDVRLTLFGPHGGAVEYQGCDAR